MNNIYTKSTSGIYIFVGQGNSTEVLIDFGDWKFYGIGSNISPVFGLYYSQSGSTQITSILLDRGDFIKNREVSFEK